MESESELNQRIRTEIRKAWRQRGGIRSPQQDLRRKNRGDSNFELYDSTLQNPVVYSSLQRRWKLHLAQRWTITPASEDPIDQEAANAAREMVSRLNFNAVCEKMLYGMFWAWSAAEIFWDGWGRDTTISKFKVLPRKYFGWTPDGEFQGRDGQKIDPRRVWTYRFTSWDDDDPNGVGLAYWLYDPAAILEGGMSGWLSFLEESVRPIPRVVYKGSDAQIQQLAVQIAQDLFDGNPVAYNELFSVEFHETIQNTRDYASLVSLSARHIRQIVLLEDTTEDRAANVALFRSQLVVEENLIASDSEHLCDTFNRSVLEPWCAQAFPDAQPPTIRRKEQSLESSLQLAQRDQLLGSIGFYPTLERIIRDYGTGFVQREPIKIGSAPNMT